MHTSCNGTRRSKPRQGWTCFHCGEHFRGSAAGELAAREHFGPTQDWSPLCIERKSVGDDDLLRMSRQARVEAQAYLRQRHEAEEEAEGAHAKLSALAQFPARTVGDAFNMFHSMEGRALASEAIVRAIEVLAPDLVAFVRTEVCGPEPAIGVSA